MAGIMDLVIILAVLGVGYYVLKSGILNNLTQPAPTTPTDTTDTTDTTETGTEDTTGTDTVIDQNTQQPVQTTDPLQELLNLLSGGGGQGSPNTIPTQPQQPYPYPYPYPYPPQQPIAAPVQPTPYYPPQTSQPVYGGNPQECQSKYNGKCNTECSSGNTSLCQACQIACGGAQIGAVSTGGGGGSNPSLCESKYHGKCNTECSSGSNSECSACRAACGSNYAKTYYVQTPMSLIASSVWRNSNYSRGVSITNAR